MNGKKMYEGEKHHFFRNEYRMGKGGNGGVYEVDIGENDYPVVAKFFEYEGKDKERRYKRFKKEIEIMSQLEDCEGIIPVIDKNCPQNVPQEKDEAWYLMPKAESYKVNRNRNILYKINDMLQLARIIEIIHKRGLAHRDIKPENILVLNKKLILSDFGLIWGMEEERLTEIDDRIGPYKILPPELERVQLDLLVDFRPSDVYLFAKVLWMTLKEDSIGFRGQYQRGDIQIYLNRNFYDVATLEPIHKLMEEATCEDMSRRITIGECIDYLEMQRQVFVEGSQDQLAEGIIRRLQYEEHCKKIVSRSEPDDLVYENKHTIYKMLGAVVSVADVYVKNLNDKENGKQIKISDINVNSDGTCLLLYYNSGRRIKEYLFSIKKVTYSKKKELMLIDLNHVDIINQEYISFGESQRSFGNAYPKIFFDSYEQIIVAKPDYP